MLKNTNKGTKRIFSILTCIAVLGLPAGAFAYCNNWVPQWRLELVAVEATGDSVSAEDLATEETRWNEFGVLFQPQDYEFGWLNGVLDYQIIIDRTPVP